MEVVGGSASFLDTFRLLWDAARKELLIFVSLQVAGAVLLGLEVVIVQLVLNQFLRLSSTHGVAQVVPEVGLLVAVLALASGTLAVMRSRRELLSLLVGQYVADRLLDVTATAPLIAFDNPEFYDKLARASEGRRRAFQLMQGVFNLSRGTVTVVAVAIAVMAVQPLLPPLLLLAFIPLALLTLGSRGQLHGFYHAWTSRDREREYIFGLLSGKEAAKEVRIFGLAAFLRGRYSELTSRLFQELSRLLNRHSIRTLVGIVLGALVMAVIVLLLAWLVVGGHMTLPQAGAAITALLLLNSSLPQIAAGSAELYECALFLEDYHSFVATGGRDLVEAPSLGGSLTSANLYSGVRLDQASFAYPGADREAIQDVSMEIKPGEVVALVGENGSGKTTLAKLVCGLYAPSNGRVWWGNQDLAALEPASVRDQLTAIFQDYVHYMLPAWQNIALGRHERSQDREAVVVAARMAGADGIIRTLGQGYETMLGSLFPGGVDLSAGQWQKVALARAFFRDTSLIVLDEPTASVDARAEHDLFERIRDLAGGRSLLLVSHRFANVRMADRIHVMDGGRIIERGSHEELVALRGCYATLYRLQVTDLIDGSMPVS